MAKIRSELSKTWPGSEPSDAAPVLLPICRVPPEIVRPPLNVLPVLVSVTPPLASCTVPVPVIGLATVCWPVRL